MVSSYHIAGQLVVRALILFLVLVCVFVPLIAQAQFGGLVPCSGVAPDPDFEGPPTPYDRACTFADLVLLAQNIINWLLGIAVFIAAILFSWGGLLYVSSGGDEGKVKQAHQIFKNVAIGFIIALAAWLIVNLITGAVLGEGYTLLNRS